MRRPTFLVFSGLVALGLALSACDAGEPSTPTADVNAFTATVVSPAGVATSLSGSALVTRDPASFQGAFYTYPTQDSSGTDLTDLLIALQAESGEELYLMRVAPTALASGTYDIEPLFDFHPPYDFAAGYVVDGEGTGAVSGTVTLAASAERVDGSFDLVLEDGSTLEGSFSAEAE